MEIRLAALYNSLFFFWEYFFKNFGAKKVLGGKTPVKKKETGFKMGEF